MSIHADGVSVMSLAMTDGTMRTPATSSIRSSSPTTTGAVVDCSRLLVWLGALLVGALAPPQANAAVPDAAINAAEANAPSIGLIMIDSSSLS